MGLQIEDCVNVSNLETYVHEMRSRAELAYRTAREHLRSAAERRKVSYDIRVKKSDIAVGDWVWYWYPRRYKGKSPKWQKSFVGPYLVTRWIEPVNIVLQKSSRAKPFVVHVDRVKKYFGETLHTWTKSNQNGREVVQQPSNKDTDAESEDSVEQQRDLMRTSLTEVNVVGSRPQRVRRKPKRFDDVIYD